MEVPSVVRNKALVHGAADWLTTLPELVDDLAATWQLTIGPSLDGGTEAHVVAVTTIDGTGAVLKLIVPRDGDAARHEITALRLADGAGCARLLADDVDRGALLVERLGPSLAEVGLTIDERHEILCRLGRRLWRPIEGGLLPSGADKGRWLRAQILRRWESLDRPCPESVIDHALDCVDRRIAAHDEERAVLVHGDLHQWNALRAADDWKLIDPDGLHAEAEYDLGIIMREDPVELLVPDPMARARRLAHLTGCDATAIWEWGAVERVSTGLLCVEIDLQPWGRQMLDAAEHITTIGD